MSERIRKLAEQAGSTHKQNLGVYQFYTENTDGTITMPYKDQAGTMEGSIKISEPIGYWKIGDGYSYMRFAIYKRFTPEQIKNTEELLGWVWVEGKAQEK